MFRFTMADKKRLMMDVCRVRGRLFTLMVEFLGGRGRDGETGREGEERKRLMKGG